MEQYKYRAVNAKGRPVRGVLSAANEADLFNQLQAAQLELISCSSVSKKGFLGGLSLRTQKVGIRDIIQFYMHLKQMQQAGIPLLESLADIRDTSDNDALRDVVSECYRDVSEGSSFSEAMKKHPKIFNELQVSLMEAGEKSGDIKGSCSELISFLKWVDSMQTMVRKATRYPIVLLCAVVVTVVIMMAFVVPQIVQFLENIFLCYLLFHL